ncbi:MAG: IclR family transcriptional regulator [Desulfotignum sp.]|nr:IclR family transcriptional regulator [Desulfotignum sp.]
MVKSAVRVMEILETVCGRKEGLTQKEISDRLNIPKSSLSSILTDMTSREYLLQDHLTKRFALGPQVLILAGGYLNNQDVVGQGRSMITRLSRETGESGALAIPIGLEALLVYKEDCIQPIMPSTQIGTRFPLYSSAVGKALLANYSNHEINRYLQSVTLKPMTKYTITDREQLLSELNDIRKIGLAYNRDGYREGITAIAAPVFNHTGHVVASISISVLTATLTPEKESRYESILKKITFRFSRLLGHNS